MLWDGWVSTSTYKQTTLKGTEDTARHLKDLARQGAEHVENEKTTRELHTTACPLSVTCEGKAGGNRSEGASLLSNPPEFSGRRRLPAG